MNASIEPRRPRRRPSVVATTASALVVTALIAGLSLWPTQRLSADVPSEQGPSVSETVSPKQIEQYCPAHMELADDGSYGDAEFHAGVGDLRSSRRFAAFGSIFHAQTTTLGDADDAHAQVLDSPLDDGSGDAAFVSSAEAADEPAVFDTRVLTARAGTGASGVLGSWATDGDVAGMSASGCVSPALEQDFLVPSTATGNTQQLLLANLSDKSTSVEIAAWADEDGKLALATSSTVTVKAGAQTSVLLSAAVPDRKALYVTARSANTPVAAVVRSVSMDGLTPKGNDFIMPLGAPATAQAIPLPSASDAVSLLAFGEQESTVTLSWMTSHGLVPMDRMKLEAGRVTSFDAKDAPKGAKAIYVQSDVACSLSARVSRSGDGGQSDFAMVEAAPAMAQSATAIPAGLDATLTVVNMDTKRVEVTMSGFDAKGALVGTKRVEADADSAVELNVADIGEDVAAVSVDQRSATLVWGAYLDSAQVTDAGLAGVAYLPAVSLRIPEQTVRAHADASIVR